MLDTILELIKSTLINRKFLVSLLTPLIAYALTQIPNFPFSTDQIVEVVVTIILFVVGGDALHDIVNSAVGNVWDSEAKQYVKPNKNTPIS